MIVDRQYAKKYFVARSALKEVIRAFKDNDASEDKAHPCIPSHDAKRVIDFINRALEYKP